MDQRELEIIDSLSLHVGFYIVLHYAGRKLSLERLQKITLFSSVT